MKLLVIGPGRGHNIEPFLDCFQEQDRWSVTFLSLRPFRFDRDRFDRLEIHEFLGVRSLPTLLKLLRRPYRAIWYHGAYHAGLSLLIFLFKRRASFMNLNVWSEQLPRSLDQPGVQARINRWIVGKADQIQCNWYGTEKLIKERMPAARTVVYPWGLDRAFLAPIEPEAESGTQSESGSETVFGSEGHAFVHCFIESIPVGSRSFFYPKSFSPASGHGLLVDATKRLRDEGIDDFQLYWWLGNIEDEGALAHYQEVVSREGLADHIRIVSEKPFLTLPEYRQVWEAMDFGLQIAFMDQLSTTFIEPMYLGKPFVATDISPYRLFEQRHGLDLGLVKPEVSSITAAMKSLLLGDGPDPDVLEARRRVIAESFDFRKNLSERLSDLEERSLAGRTG